jgi:hypothetical protein
MKFVVAVFLLVSLNAVAQTQPTAEATPAPQITTDAQKAEPTAPGVAAQSSSEVNPGESKADAYKYNVLLDQRESRLTLVFYTQLSQFKREGQSLLGYTFEGVASYALDSKLCGQFAINQALSTKGNVSVLYTGFRSSLAYALSGNFISSNNALFVNTRPTVHVRTGDRPLFAVEGGVDQYLFNGVSRIVPATGISASARYDFSLWRLRASAVFRYGMLVVSDSPVSLITTGIGAMMRF